MGGVGGHDGASMSMSGYSDRDLDLGGLQLGQKEVVGDGRDGSNRAGGQGQRASAMLSRPGMRRRVTGELPMPGGAVGRSGALSPLNPKARVTSGLSTGNVTGQPVGAGVTGNGGAGASAAAAGTGRSVPGDMMSGSQAQKGGGGTGRRPTVIDVGKRI